MLPLRCFLIIIIATVLPFLLSVYVSLATATIITALDYELLISRDRACARWRGGQRERRRREDSRCDAWRTFLSPINESTKYHPYTLALSRLVIIKRYKREADCARLIALLWRTNACETKREELYGRMLKNDSSSWWWKACILKWISIYSIYTQLLEK